METISIPFSHCMFLEFGAGRFTDFSETIKGRASGLAPSRSGQNRHTWSQCCTVLYCTVLYARRSSGGWVIVQYLRVMYEYCGECSPNRSTREYCAIKFTAQYSRVRLGTSEYSRAWYSTAHLGRVEYSEVHHSTAHSRCSPYTYGIRYTVYGLPFIAGWRNTPCELTRAEPTSSNTTSQSPTWRSEQSSSLCSAACWPWCLPTTSN